MILRIWHGYTVPENAESYENLLVGEVLPGIIARKIPGFQKVEVLRRPLDNEVEFTVMMTFDGLDSVKDFVGKDYEDVYVPDKARAVLSRFDTRAIHAEIKASINTK